MNNKNISHGINYLYFGIFVIFLLLTTGSNVFIKENVSGSRIFFFLYGAGQVFIEVSLFIFLAWIFRHYFYRFIYQTFIAITFILFSFQILDFFLERILDQSIWETFSFLFDESYENFFYLLDASGVSLSLWMASFAALAFLPFIGMLFYFFSEKVSLKQPVNMKKEWLIQSFICLPAALLFWEYSATPLLHPDTYTGFKKSLPWKFTFLQPRTVTYPIAGNLQKPKEEKELLLLANQITTLEKKPNIYLFVIESLREDFINHNVAPHLTHFKKNSLHFAQAYSNGNGSHLSWFSIFHSQFPYFWNQFSEWKVGSIPLYILKKMGYKIRMYSSAQLNYYGMQKLLFGENNYLLDSIQTFHHPPPMRACVSDAKALKALQNDLRNNSDLKEGQLFIVFWDSTHFDYSWPQHWQPKFTPIAKQLSYFQMISTQKNIEPIKNRYRNALHYIDTLFGRFMKSLPNAEDSIVIVTGDHGEEFLEQGHLFHGSHLGKQQTHIPLYMKLGNKKGECSSFLASQMDIFPTIIDYLKPNQISFLEGASVLQKQHWPFVITARYNASRTPYEFCIHNGQVKFIAQFDNRKNIYQTTQLKIKSLKNKEDQCIYECKSNIQKYIKQEFGPAINRIFKNSQRAPAKQKFVDFEETL